MMTQKQAPGDVEVRWAYRPDDRAKQGTTEFLPRDRARQVIHEGLAVAVPLAPEPDEPAEDAIRPTKKTAASPRDN